MNIAYLNIGTNQGHRRSNLERAVALLRQRAEIDDVVVSDVITSEPWGYDSPNEFMNIGVRCVTSLSPEELLRTTQAIEQAISPASHRDATGGYVDRMIDIDIIAMTDSEGTDYVVDSPTLTLPHPRMCRRAFVLIPMMQLAPLWCHPATGMTAAEIYPWLNQ